MCLKKIFCIKNSQKSRTWVFAGKTGEFFWEESLTFFQNPLVWQACYRSRLKWYFYCKFLQKFRIWFFAQIDSFFRKGAWNFSKTKNIRSFFKLRLNLYNGKRLLETFKIWGFFGKIDGLIWKHCCFFSEILSVAYLF